LENKTHCQALEEVLTDNSIRAFHLFGDLMYLQASSPGAYFVYKVLENEVAPVFSMSNVWGEQKLADDNIIDTDSYKYLPFFVMKNDAELKSDISIKNKTIFACELSTGKVKCLDVIIDSERPWIEDVYMNWDGGLNIVVSPGKGKDADMQNQQQYFISREKWEELFAKAPYCILEKGVAVI
jgi:hypothetical protein